MLVEEKLRPLGVVANPDGTSPELAKPDPFLALRFRKAVVSERAVRAATRLFLPLFWPPVVLAVLGALIAFDIWLFGVHGVAHGVRVSIYQPAFLLLVVGLVVLSAGFHEIGHAVACRYGGATPGVMGVGIYIAWPAFYTDVTDAYRLGKAGRLRTDLGGVYFNGVFVLATAGAYFATGFEPLLLVIVIQHFEVVHQLLPFVRLDGYYIVSDLTGVPDLFARMRPILGSLVPWKKTERQVTDLKLWARLLVTLWVVVVVPILLFNLTVLAVSVPRIFATAWDSAGQQIDQMGDGGALEIVAGVVQIALLSIPVAGIGLTFVLLGRRLGAGVWHVTDERPVARVALGLVGVTTAGFLAFTWLPNGDYEPIQRGERGLIQDYAGAVRRVATGRAGIVPLQQSEERGELEAPAPATNDPPPTGTEPATTTTTQLAPPGEAPSTTEATTTTASSGSSSTSASTSSSTTSSTSPTTTAEP